MQEGAGVRQVVEEELRRAGLRVRELESKLELGLQESVKSAVGAGYGVAFISRTAIEGELAAGRSPPRASAGIEPTRQIYVVRAKGRTPSTGCGRVPRVRRRAGGMIVRWGLDALPDVLAELGARSRSWSRAGAGTRSIFPSPRASRVSSSTSRARRWTRPSPPRRERTGSWPSAEAARSTRRRRSAPRPACRSSRSRRRTRAPSGRRASACATSSGASRSAGGAPASRASSTSPS